ncbi:alpha/beta-tubulin-N-acetyltransferase 9 [Palaemon carinicauda]|uniref:alpha/beta-tubulin-N-acetyltransferase 9 n=1 Tax=Palaemon carinicauda TaxID=392227 RepID=UPI0035B68A65
MKQVRNWEANTDFVGLVYSIMKINGKTQLMGDKVILVPYKKSHVKKYHEWMQSPRLQELTASEPLSEEEEYEMQKSWYEDDNKCTFIILDKKCFEETRSEEQSMIGDTNLYLSNDEEKTIAEGEIMIAETAFVGKKRGWEAMLLMFRYGVEFLGIAKYQVKIGLSNTPSICMFKKMNFNTVSESKVFNEITMESEVNETWKTWLTESTKQFSVLPHTNEDLE